MIAPGSQRKTGRPIAQQNFKIRLLIPGLFRGDLIDLGMHRAGGVLSNGSLFQFFDGDRSNGHSLLSDAGSGHPIKFCSSSEGSKS